MTAHRPATFVYASGTTALRGDMLYVEKRRLTYNERRRYFYTAVDDIEGLSCPLLEGAFYAWFDARSFGLGSKKFCERLRDRENVAFSLGNRFGVKTDGFIRVPLVQPVPVLEDVVDRLKRFVQTL
jgi:aspartate/methionine/tyrosine aminotransferase